MAAFTLSGNQNVPFAKETLRRELTNFLSPCTVSNDISGNEAWLAGLATYMHHSFVDIHVLHAQPRCLLEESGVQSIKDLVSTVVVKAGAKIFFSPSMFDERRTGGGKPRIAFQTDSISVVTHVSTSTRRQPNSLS